MKCTRTRHQLLLKEGMRRIVSAAAVCLENEAGGLFNILPDLFVGRLSRQRDSLFVAAAPGVNALVADLGEQPKHLGDF